VNLAPRYKGHQAPRRGGATPRAARVVTFKIQFARRSGDAVTALRQYPALRDPDVLLLQEMDAPSVAEVARKLALNYVYFPAAIHPKTGRATSATACSHLGRSRMPGRSFCPIRAASTASLEQR